MNDTMSYAARRHTATSKFEVGDRVRIRFGDRWVIARIVEDRGAIGVGGRALLRIQIDDPKLPDDHREFELPASEVHLSA
jgi:hypothetical protein